jgi:hypothetical protein
MMIDKVRWVVPGGSAGEAFAAAANDSGNDWPFAATNQLTQIAPTAINLLCNLPLPLPLPLVFLTVN